MAKSDKTPRKSKTEPGATPQKEPEISAPAEKTATNLLIADIALRAGMRVGRLAIEKALLRRNFTAKQTKRLMGGRSISKGILPGLAARVASRSIPGAVLVGGGLLAKALYDRRKSARKQPQPAEEPAPPETEKD